MSYPVKQLAKIAGISVRTLHYYDQIGLLKPARSPKNRYRFYEEDDLLKLQQIMFFRELDMPLEEIRRIISSPLFDVSGALRDHRKLIRLKMKRLGKLLETIDRTIKKINKDKKMEDEELYGGFTKEEMERYSDEARQRWGHTEAYKQSAERVKKMGKVGLNKVLEESGKNTQAIAQAMGDGLSPKSEKVQRLIAKHYDGLHAFYEPDPEMYKGLANMYVEDERFRAFYEKIAPGLAEFMRKSMLLYAELIQKN